MRQGKKLSLSAIIKRVVGVTLLLALFEVIFIFFYMNNKKAKKLAVNKSTEVIQTPATAAKDSTPVASIVKPEVSKQEQVTPQTIYTSEPVQQPATPAVVENKKVEVKKPEEKKIEEKKVEEKKKIVPPVVPVETFAQRQLSQEEITQLLNNIIAQKAKFNNATNCIQIRKTKASNIDNGFEIATFLKQNGFVISGREVIGANIKGITIDASESCIKLTIGTL